MLGLCQNCVAKYILLFFFAQGTQYKNNVHPVKWRVDMELSLTEHEHQQARAYIALEEAVESPDENRLQCNETALRRLGHATFHVHIIPNDHTPFVSPDADVYIKAFANNYVALKEIVAHCWVYARTRDCIGVPKPKAITYNSGGDCFLVMERVEGERLEAYVDKAIRARDVYKIVKCCMDVAYMIHVLQRDAGVVHGDLNLTNILRKRTKHTVNRHHVLTLLDFELSYAMPVLEVDNMQRPCPISSKTDAACRNMKYPRVDNAVQATVRDRIQEHTRALGTCAAGEMDLRHFWLGVSIKIHADSASEQPTHMADSAINVRALAFLKQLEPLDFSPIVFAEYFRSQRAEFIDNAAHVT